MKELTSKRGFICDMDGVIYHGSKLLPGAKAFVSWLKKENKVFLFLTNNSSKTRKELQIKLATLGINVEEKHFYTSALATASFLRKQCPGGSAYVIGDAAFVGDTLFMPDGGTARADFPGGDAATLYHSIEKILALPPETRLFICPD